MGLTEFTPRKKARFIKRLTETGNITKAASYAPISRPCAYEHKENDPTFQSAWDDAIAVYAERLESEADRRALEGTARKKFWQGLPINDPETGLQYEEREFSDTLLIFRLKALKPDVYADRSKSEVTGKDGGPIRVGQPENLSHLSDEELAQMRAIHEAADARRNQEGAG
jgi:hypothetical protein